MMPLAVAVGDPAGVGPEVSVRAARAVAASERVVLFGDASRLKMLALRAGFTPSQIRYFEPGSPFQLVKGTLGLADTGAVSEATVRLRRPSVDGGRAQLAALDAALHAIVQGRARALVTGPVSKEAVSYVKPGFSGHTEYLAQVSGLAPDAVTMMFLGRRLRLALATTHLRLADVPRQVRGTRVARSVRHLARALRALGVGRRGPVTIAVTGVNPHAGEGGLLGTEEAEVVVPVLEQLRGEPEEAIPGLELIGPLPAEAALRLAASRAVDGVVAMFHDQATIASKLLDWARAVNVTWGLPFVRTSVDHGVAYQASACGEVHPGSMTAALRMAARLARDRGRPELRLPASGTATDPAVERVPRSAQPGDPRGAG